MGINRHVRIYDSILSYRKSATELSSQVNDLKIKAQMLGVTITEPMFPLDPPTWWAHEKLQVPFRLTYILDSVLHLLLY